MLIIISPAYVIKARILEAGTQTMSALIAANFGDATKSQLSALLTAGFVLFLITLVVNSGAALFIRRSRSGAGDGDLTMPSSRRVLRAGEPVTAASSQALATQDPGSSTGMIGCPCSARCCRPLLSSRSATSTSSMAVGRSASWRAGIWHSCSSMAQWSASSNPRPIVVERLVAATLYLAAAIVVFALASTVIYTFGKGWHALVHADFLTHDMSGVSPTAPLNQGGVLQAIVGTVVEVGLAVAVSLPLGIGTAVYMSEVGGRGSRLVRTVVEAMTALPEILAGLFVYVTLIVGLGLPKSGLAASIAMAVTMIPIIARASRSRSGWFPTDFARRATRSGATHWKTVRKVVLPSARAGLATAMILAIARGIGETAVVLITSGASSFLTFNPVGNPMNSLPLFIYTAYITGEPAAIARAFGAASVLLAMVLVLFVATRFLARVKRGCHVEALASEARRLGSCGRDRCSRCCSVATQQPAQQEAQP